MPAAPNFLRWFAILALTVLSVSAQTVVTLQNATATFSQAGCPITLAIDGDTSSGGVGWAISPNQNAAQTAVFETTSDVGFSGGTLLSFTLTQNYTSDGAHELGRFRISITTDDRTTFADGLTSGGDVTANWTVVSLGSLIATSGATMTVQGDDSVLVSGTQTLTDIYTFSVITGMTAITGLRLEAIPDGSFVNNGSGRAYNGNFVLSEFAVTATAIPEPSTYGAAAGIAVLAWALYRRRR